MKETSKLAAVLDGAKYCALALMTILNIYSGVLIINLGFVVLLVLMLAEILLNKGQFFINREFLIIMALILLLNIVTGFLHMRDISIKTVMNNSASILMTTVVGAYYIKSSVVNKDKFFKLLCVIGVLCTVFIFYQYVMYLGGTTVYGYIPGLTVDPAVVDDPLNVSISWGRPTSFFTEPAHYAIFILPIYTLTLYRRKFLLSALFVAGLIISTSSTGLMGILVITGIFIIRERKIPLVIKWIFAIIGVVIVLQLLPTIDQSGILEKVKFVNLASNVRVFGTLQYFNYFGVKELFFGVGLNQLANYMKQFTREDISNYASAVVFAFFSFGILGGALWSYYMVRLFRLSTYKLLYVLLLLVSLTDQILFNRNLVYLLLMLHVFIEPVAQGSGERGALEGAHDDGALSRPEDLP